MSNKKLKHIIAIDHQLIVDLVKASCDPVLLTKLHKLDAPQK